MSDMPFKQLSHEKFAKLSLVQKLIYLRALKAGLVAPTFWFLPQKRVQRLVARFRACLHAKASSQLSRLPGDDGS